MKSASAGSNGRRSFTERLRRFVRGVTPECAYRDLARCLDAGYCLYHLGWGGYRGLWSLLRGHLPASEQLVSLKVPSLLHPIWLRPGTTDVEEIIYTTIRQVYGKYSPTGPVRVIIDAGANLGDTTAWYLSNFPEARVLAIEPDPQNFRLLQRNAMPYGGRVELIPAALWSEPGLLRLQPSTPNAPDGIYVCAANGDGNCPATSMSELLQKQRLAQVDIFKCDIEGAETAVFSDGASSWLGRIRCLVVETHGTECLDAVLQATVPQGFSHYVYRNLHFFLRPDLHACP